jgi:hypothetical protein
MGLCLSPLDSRSVVDRLVWMEGNIFSLSSSNFSVPLSLFYNSELLYVCLTGLVASAQL